MDPKGPSTDATEAFLYKVSNCFGVNCTYAVKVNPTNDGSGSCGTPGPALLTYRNVNSTIAGLGDKVCEQFGWADAADELRIDINVVIPKDAPTGDKGATMIAQAECPPLGCP